MISLSPFIRIGGIVLKKLRGIVFPFVAVGIFLFGWYVGLPAKKTAGGADGASSTLWTCSMHPQIRQPNPGLCPICEMDLIPLEGGEGGGLREVSVTPEAAALMDLRVSPVVKQPAEAKVRLFGKLAYDERRATTTTARVAGRLDRFYVDYTGTFVRKGDHIAEVYSPQLVVAQKELILAVQNFERAQKTGRRESIDTQRRILEGVREKLRLLELTPMQIDGIGKLSEPSDHITLYAPMDGVVTHRNVAEGDYVKTGQPLFAVADLKSLWLNAEAYESDLQWLHFAQEIVFSVEALPGRTFKGRVAYIDQEIDPMRRVAKVRVNVQNDDLALKPGMFAVATVEVKVAADGSVIDPGLAGKWISPMHPEVIQDGPGQCSICGMDLVPAEELGFIRSGDKEHENPLLVPTSAVLRTGQRALAYVRLDDKAEPTFEGRELIIGPRVGEYFTVENGLAEGELVVSRGAFKLDSELQIKAKPSMMNANAGLIEAPANSAPDALAGQWQPVLRGLGVLRQAALTTDGPAAEQALARVSASVAAINTESFQPEPLKLWDEFSSRLTNSLALAEQHATHDPAATYDTVSRAVEQAGVHLGLPYQPPNAAAAPANPAITKALPKILEAYFKVSRSLSGDDAETARLHQAALLRAAEVLPAAPDTKAFKDAVTAMTRHEEIAEIREAFEPVSVGLSALVAQNGEDNVGNVYVVHCPMAFESKGADWLSEAPIIENPYFGSDMFSCGSVKATLSIDVNSPPEKKTPMEMKEDPHAGHNH